MTDSRLILLDEHVGRIFERVLREQGFDVVQAKDQFGEHTIDRELLEWCAENDTVLVSNNGKDFRYLHEKISHAGGLLYEDQSLPDTDPEGVARAVDEIFTQSGPEGLSHELVDLQEWYDWLHE